jgi:hypothetical protein
MSRRGRNGRSLALVTDRDSGPAAQEAHGVTGLINAISNGAFDRDLVELYDTIVRRLETLRAIHAASALLDFEVGDRVELNRRCSPALPTWSSWAGGRPRGPAGDRQARSANRRFRGGELRCSPLALDKVVERG